MAPTYQWTPLSLNDASATADSSADERSAMTPAVSILRDTQGNRKPLEQQTDLSQCAGVSK